MTIHNEHAGQLLVGLERIADLCLRCKIHQQLCLTKMQFYIDDCEVGQRSQQGKQESRQEESTTIVALRILEKCTVALFKEILLFMSASVESCQTGTFRKAIKGTLQPHKIIVHLEALEAKATAVEAAADACYRLGVTDKLEHLQDILNHTFCRVNDELTQVLVGIKESEHLEMLQWISRIDYETDYENARTIRLKGTCNWLLKHDKYA